VRQSRIQQKILYLKQVEQTEQISNSTLEQVPNVKTNIFAK